MVVVMDLISTDNLWRDQKIITDGVYDLAFGRDENNFKLTLSEKVDSLTGGALLYIDGTEYGGVLDKVGYDDSQEEIFYEGRSWSGVLNSKIIMPDPTTTFSGYVIEEGTTFETAITDLLEYMEVLTEDTYERTAPDGDSLTYGWSFLLDIDDAVKNILVVNNYVDPNDEDSTPDDPNQQYEDKYLFEEYVQGYDGIAEFCKSLGITLTYYLTHITVSGKTITNPVLHFIPSTDYTQTEEFDKETLPIDGTHLLNKINHLIGLGNRIDNKQTRVNVHIYMDANGNLTEDKSQWAFAGVNEIAHVEEFGNVEKNACATQAMKKMKELIEEDELNLKLYANHEYLIGDTVGRRDELLFGNEWIKQQITKKIVKLDGQDITIEYEVGGKK